MNTQQDTTADYYPIPSAYLDEIREERRLQKLTLTLVFFAAFMLGTTFGYFLALNDAEQIETMKSASYKTYTYVGY